MAEHERTIVLKGRPMSRGEASAAIMQALENAGYVMTAAALALGVEYRQFARIVTRLALGAEIDAKRIAAGVTGPRPPRSAVPPDPDALLGMSGPAFSALQTVSKLPPDERAQVIKAADALFGGKP